MKKLVLFFVVAIIATTNTLAQDLVYTTKPNQGQQIEKTMVEGDLAIEIIKRNSSNTRLIRATIQKNWEDPFIIEVLPQGLSLRDNFYEKISSQNGGSYSVKIENCIFSITSDDGKIKIQFNNLGEIIFSQGIE